MWGGRLRGRSTPFLNMKLIGIVGRHRAGKDTAGCALIQEGYARVAFADTLKGMMVIMLRSAGLNNDDVHRMIEGDQKETPLAVLCGKSARFAMQTLGTEWGRKLIGSDIWIQIALSRAAKLPATVITDVRFANEAAAIKRAGGTTIRVVRSHQPLFSDGADGHVSEAGTDLIETDFIVVNNSTIEALQKKVLEIARKINS